MKAVKAVNKGARWLSTALQFCGLPIPIPQVPSQVVEKLDGFVDGLGGENGYACVNQLAQVAKAGEAGAAQALSRFQQHEFTAFLKKSDPEVRATHLPSYEGERSN